jgi:arylsulfatase A-like enzyme
MLVLLLACGPPAPPPADQPNVLLITLDTTRADHLGTYGYFRETSPHLDALADESVVFEQCVVPMAVTLPSHTSMMTGIYPFEHGILANNVEGDRRWVRAPLVTLAEHLGAHGWRTGAFVTGAPLRRGSGIDEGFDVWTEPPPHAAVRRGEEATDELLRFVRRGRQPFFAWLHLFDAHGGNPLPEWRHFEADRGLAAWAAERRLAPSLKRGGGEVEVEVSEIIDRYDDEIRYMDAQIGRIVDAGRRDGWLAHTVLVVLGDHGEGLGQHGLSAHGYVWDEQLRAPFLVRAPGLAPARVRDPVSAVDLVPTLLGRIGRPAPAAWPGPLSGIDVLAKRPVERAIFAQSSAKLRQHGRAVALVRGAWRYHREIGGAEHLFDLAADPFELDDRAATEPQRLAAMRAEADRLETAQRANGRALGAGGTAPLDPAVRGQLEALGYVE